MSKYYRKDGLLVPPVGKSKFHVSWSLENILFGFKKFYEENNRWPMQTEINSCPYLPNIKTIERKFGGITEIRKKLGLNDINYSKGVSRSKISKKVGERGYRLEENIYTSLYNRFHEPFVHNQSRIDIVNNPRIIVDFLVFHELGKFAVDVFYPSSDSHNFFSNVSVKYNTYKNFPFILYLCIGNPEIDDKMIDSNFNSRKIIRNDNVKLLSLDNFLKEIMTYKPFNNPYK